MVQMETKEKGRALSCFIFILNISTRYFSNLKALIKVIVKDLLHIYIVF